MNIFRWDNIFHFLWLQKLILTWLSGNKKKPFFNLICLINLRTADWPNYEPDTSIGESAGSHRKCKYAPPGPPGPLLAPSWPARPAHSTDDQTWKKRTPLTPWSSTFKNIFCQICPFFLPNLASWTSKLEITSRMSSS